MSPLNSVSSVRGQATCLPCPFLDVAPLPGRPATDRPPRFRKSETPGSPLVDGVAGHGEALGYLHHAHRLDHEAHCRQRLDAPNKCRQNTDTSRSGPGAAPTARGLATTEVAVTTPDDPTRLRLGGVQ